MFIFTVAGFIQSSALRTKEMYLILIFQTFFGPARGKIVLSASSKNRFLTCINRYMEELDATIAFMKCYM